MKLLLSCLVLVALSSWVSTTEAYFSASVSTSLVSLITGQWFSSGIEIFLWRNGAEYKLVDLVKNGSFQSGLADWQHYGNVRSISQSCCGNQTAIAILGNDPAQEQFELAVLSQQLPAHSYPLVVSFWYKLITSEDLQLFDSPAMIVEINGIPRFQAFANEAKNKRGDLQESEWRFITLGLPPSPEEGSSIKIIQGNTGDNKKQLRCLLAEYQQLALKSNRMTR